MIEYAFERIEKIRFEKDCGGRNIVSFEINEPNAVAFTNAAQTITGHNDIPLATYHHSWEQIFANDVSIIIEGDLKVTDTEHSSSARVYNGKFNFLELCRGNIVRVENRRK